MTNPIGTQWETALLNKLTNNGERIAVVEKEVKDIKQIANNLDKHLNQVDVRLSQIEKLLGWLRVIGTGVVAIALSLIANFVYSYLTRL